MWQSISLLMKILKGTQREGVFIMLTVAPSFPFLFFSNRIFSNPNHPPTIAESLAFGAIAGMCYFAFRFLFSKISVFPPHSPLTNDDQLM